MADPAKLSRILSDAVRLARLKATDLMGSEPDEAFDRLSNLASKAVHTPVALVTLVGEDQQFFKSCLGLPEPWNTWRKTPLSHSFCQHVLVSCEPLIINDARIHPDLKDNLAIRDLGVIAYLGIPLRTEDGACLGSFCVIDSKPREWTQEEIWMVQTLAQSVMTEIELRHHKAKLEAMVKERTQQLAEALKKANAANEAKRNFIAALSHELRTPLTPALLYASSAEDDDTLQAEARELFGAIREQIEMESRLIEDLLHAADLGNGRVIPAMERLDLHATLKDLIHRFADDARDRSIQLSMGFQATDAQIIADPSRLGQALGKILENALKFSEPGMRVEIRTRNTTHSRVPAIQVEFVDEGVGLAAEELPRVFDGFWQGSTGLTRKYGGIGVGLTIARTLIQMHGGDLSVSSAGKGRGTTFVVRLVQAPVTSEPQPQAPLSARQA